MNIDELKIEETNKQQTYKKDYINPAKEILGASTLQFLLSPFRTRRLFIKIVNFCFILFSLILSWYLVATNIKSFLNYETVTSIDTIIENESDFPTVSICSENIKDFQINVKQIFFNRVKLLDEWNSYLQTYNDSTYGNCYRFNGNLKNRSMSKRGSSGNGLLIYFNTSIYFDTLVISINNFTKLPTTIYDKGFQITPGNLDYFNIKRIYDQKLEHPYNDCFKNINDFDLNKTIIELMENKNWGYSQKECNRICTILKFHEMSKCNCSVKYEHDLYNVCVHETEDQSIKNCYYKFMNYFNDNQQAFCSQYCPLECDSFNYDISTHKVPAFKYAIYDKLDLDPRNLTINSTWQILTSGLNEFLLAF